MRPRLAENEGGGSTCIRNRCCQASPLQLSPCVLIQSIQPRTGERAHMKIEIIGADNIGSALTRRFTAAGHQVFVANSRGPQTLTELAAETGAKPVNVNEAAHAGDVVVVTIPEKNISGLPADLFKDVPASVVVIDTGNYYPC